jgi:hypothetical protein
VGPRAGLDGCGKSRPPPGFDPRTVQPVASRYNVCAIPAHFGEGYGWKAENRTGRPRSAWNALPLTDEHDEEEDDVITT